MSARDQLSQELAVLPDAVAQDLLDYLHTSLKGPQTPEPPPGSDYFADYWRQWYGRCEGEKWEEPPELPFEEREAW